MPTDPMEEPSEDDEDSACIGPEEAPEVTSTATADYHPDRWS
jgi:hypothetical protein